MSDISHLDRLEILFRIPPVDKNEYTSLVTKVIAGMEEYLIRFNKLQNLESEVYDYGIRETSDCDAETSDMVKLAVYVTMMVLMLKRHLKMSVYKKHILALPKHPLD